jgi:hypothetical protein
VYEWQIHDTRPQVSPSTRAVPHAHPPKLVPLRGYNSPSTAYVATFVRSQSGSCFRRRDTSSLFVPPEGVRILDDIVVTFIYFECKWRDKEGARARSSLSGPMM